MFTKSYAPEQIDRGMDMIFHPVTGEKLGELAYSKGRRLYFTEVSCVGWGEAVPVFRQRIGGGPGCKMGDPYPNHWRFDPYTGQPLS